MGPVTIPLRNIIAWWPGDNNTNDISPNGNNLNWIGAGYEAGAVNGGPNTCFNFLGKPAGASAPDSPSLNISGPTLSIESWVRVFWGGVNNPALLHKTGGSYSVKINTSNHFIFMIGASVWDAGYANIFSSWNHVAFTYNQSGGMKFYHNGSLSNTNILPNSPIIPTPGPALVGKDINNNWGGDIDELSLYDIELSAAQIAAIYNQGSAGKYAIVV